MIHAQCRELSLSTDAFSFHAYDRFVVAPGPYTIQHLGNRRYHQRTLIVGAPGTPSAWISNLTSCALIRSSSYLFSRDVFEGWLSLKITEYRTVRSSASRSLSSLWRFVTKP